MSIILEYFDLYLGLSAEGKDLGAMQMSLRALIVFAFAIAAVRFGDGRFMGRHTALDVMLGIIFGSVVSRAITGTAPFFPTLIACVVLVALHWAMAAVSFRSSKFGWLVKGRPTHQLVNDGKIEWDHMRRTHISEHDLQEAIRQHGHSGDIGKVDAAYLERNGSISVIPKERRKKASNRPPQ